MDGRAYTGRQGLGATFQAFPTSRLVAKAERYPAGAVVEVWYDPSRPERSTLTPGGGAAEYVGAGAAAVVLGAGIWIVVAAGGG